MAITIDGMRESTFGELISQYAPDELHLFDSLRVFIDDIGNFWFIGKDLASIMGYSDTDDAIRRHVPDQYKLTRRFTGSGQGRDMIIVNELGLYALAMKSKLPQAYQFQDWVYRVISRIRQYGGYISPDPRLKQVVDIIPEYLRPAFQAMYDRGVQSQQSIIEEMKPKADFYDRAMNSSNVIPMTVIAKDFGMSANELHMLLNKLGIIYRVSDTWVLYKQYQGKGYTATKSTVPLRDQFGNIHEDCEIATYWTEKGRMFVYGILGANNQFPMI